MSSSNKKIYIYSDESRHRTERFMLLAGLWILKDSISQVETMISEIRQEFGYDKDGVRILFKGEFKWTKVSKKHLEAYKKFIDILFKAIDGELIRYNVMLVDTQNPTVQQHNNIKGSGFYKLLYQLYFQNCKVPGLYWIYPDKIKNATHDVNLQTLQKSLESSLQKKFINILSETKIVQEIKPIDSKKSEFIQLVDVVTGAIGYYQNRHFEKEGASFAKKELMKYVLDKIIYSGALKFDGKKFLIVKSTRFNIWLFRPKNKNTP